jgi:hypothetical protein
LSSFRRSEDEIAEFTGVRQVGEGLTVQIRGYRANIGCRRKDILDRFKAIEGKDIGAWHDTVRSGLNGFGINQAFFDKVAGESPLATHTDAVQSSIAQHPIDSGAVNVEQILQLFGG